MIRTRLIHYGGSQRFKIYGTLKCKSGKKMMKENRVFFSSVNDAIENGYRPCGHCCKREYAVWKIAMLPDRNAW
ncbi:MAG: Ada metal-binding domain-containing protein [Chryseolinea sp.]